jgi:hypothetical protein
MLLVSYLIAACTSVRLRLRPSFSGGTSQAWADWAVLAWRGWQLVDVELVALRVFHRDRSRAGTARPACWICSKAAERLMRELGIAGAAARRKRPRTTMPDAGGARGTGNVTVDVTTGRETLSGKLILGPSAA